MFHCFLKVDFGHPDIVGLPKLPRVAFGVLFVHVVSPDRGFVFSDHDVDFLRCFNVLFFIAPCCFSERFLFLILSLISFVNLGLIFKVTFFLPTLFLTAFMIAFSGFEVHFSFLRLYFCLGMSSFASLINVSYSALLLQDSICI